MTNDHETAPEQCRVLFSYIGPRLSDDERKRLLEFMDTLPTSPINFVPVTIS